jgi:hypothetical protein
MRPLTFCVLTVLVMVTVLPVLADDQQKAEKQINKITAMATDSTGRRIVSMTISDVLEVKRPELVRERRLTGLNYGSLFVTHQLISAGASMTAIAVQLNLGKNIWQIATEQRTNWKQISAAAKKLNNKIEDNLYKRFSKSQPYEDRDQADHYNPDFDVVNADYAVTQEEIEQAQNTYIFWRDRASERRGERLDTVKEQAARLDHIRAGGPQGRDAGMGSLPPAAGGLPPN